jgi:16S rRNA (cytosine967-C5)-methyltransferase
MPTASRVLALRVLQDVEGRGPTLADRLARPDVAQLDERDRAFLHELVLGTLRRRGALDHVLAAAVGRPLADLQPPALLPLLRLGAYQLLYMRVPDRAAVSESVDIAREAAPKAGGLVNAVLRRVAREGMPGFPDPASDPLGWLTTEGSLPTWLAERWLAELGAAPAVDRARTFLEPAPHHVRLNPRHADAAERMEARGAG